MKKKILIPTDFSKNAWNALIYAAELFKNEYCTFYVINTYGVSGYALGDMVVPEIGSVNYENASNISKDGLSKVKDMLDFRGENPKHNYEWVSEFNDTLDALRSFIEKKDIALVVMGTKGLNNAKGALFGSNTVLAMEKLRNCPVLGVPLDARVACAKEIVMPTSFNTHYKRKELLALVEIAQLQDATICVLHVDSSEDLTESQKENKVLLSECLEGANHSFYHLSSGNPTTATLNFIESRESDMVAIINRKHAFFGSVFSTPMIKELGMFSKVPILTMHDLRN